MGQHGTASDVSYVLKLKKIIAAFGLELPYTWILFYINVFETWDYLYNKYYGREWLYKDIIKCCAATE